MLKANISSYLDLSNINRSAVCKYKIINNEKKSKSVEFWYSNFYNANASVYMENQLGKYTWMTDFNQTMPENLQDITPIVLNITENDTAWLLISRLQSDSYFSASFEARSTQVKPEDEDVVVKIEYRTSKTWKIVAICLIIFSAILLSVFLIYVISVQRKINGVKKGGFKKDIQQDLTLDEYTLSTALTKN